MGLGAHQSTRLIGTGGQLDQPLYWTNDRVHCDGVNASGDCRTDGSLEVGAGRYLQLLLQMGLSAS